MLGSTVAHHHGVGRGRGDRLTVTPLLTASLSLESDPLADQLSLAGAAGANRLEGEPSGGEFGRGGGGEVHRVLCGVVGVGVAPSVTVADVPLGDGGRDGADAISDLLADLLLCHDLGGVLGEDGGHVEFGFVHAVSLQAGDAPRGGQWTVQAPNTRSAMASVISVARHHFIGAP